jgi:membrane-associated protease RseP (regulator of RpoE activity)
MGTLLPVIPVDVLRASTLGGSLVEFFLGKNILMEGQPVEAVIEMHPYAVAGFMGIIVNSLALLPLGNTDGGRVAVAMFGRRGAYVVKTFTTLLLCISGLFGLDQANILLSYALFATIWQRELETPSRNEADELDFGRGLLGIFAALLVGLALIPMQ